jgi:hypothetical protein
MHRDAWQYLTTQIADMNEDGCFQEMVNCKCCSIKHSTSDTHDSLNLRDLRKRWDQLMHRDAWQYLTT